MPSKRKNKKGGQNNGEPPGLYFSNPIITEDHFRKPKNIEAIQENRNLSAISASSKSHYLNHKKITPNNYFEKNSFNNNEQNFYEYYQKLSNNKKKKYREIVLNEDPTLKFIINNKKEIRDKLKNYNYNISKIKNQADILKNYAKIITNYILSKEKITKVESKLKNIVNIIQKGGETNRSKNNIILEHKALFHKLKRQQKYYEKKLKNIEETYPELINKIKEILARQ